MASNKTLEGELIKDAVYGEPEEEDKDMDEYNTQSQTRDQTQIQPPMINAPVAEAGEYTASQDIYQEKETSPQYDAPPQYSPPAQEYSQSYSPPDQNYYTPNYNSYTNQQSVSVDTITEIADQIFEEKATIIRDQLEKTLSFKNAVESKIDYLDERLKRIERILDRLQLSILQKVGDYLTNVEDIKKEMIETQKTFKALTEKHSRHQ